MAESPTPATAALDLDAIRSRVHPGAPIQVFLEQGPRDVLDLATEVDRLRVELEAARANLEAVIAEAVAALEAAPRYQDLVPMVHASRVDQVVRALQRGGDPVVLREHDAKVVRDAINRVRADQLENYGVVLPDVVGVINQLKAIAHAAEKEQES